MSLPNQPFPFHPAACRRRARHARLKWYLATRGPAALKRMLDLAVVVPAMILLAPVAALLALAVCLSDGGPALYWQRRVGRDGKVFAFPKFRTMRVDSDLARAALEQANQHGPDAVTFKLRRDPRITPLGRWLRRFSVDELPQLWCVLRGDMSLVGPRPALEGEVARYTLRDRQRLAATPGLTCVWQVSGRSDVPFPEQVEMDLAYIRRPGIAADLVLLLRTVPAVIAGRGAY